MFLRPCRGGDIGCAGDGGCHPRLIMSIAPLARGDGKLTSRSAESAKNRLSPEGCRKLAGGKNADAFAAPGTWNPQKTFTPTGVMDGSGEWICRATIGMDGEVRRPARADELMMAGYRGCYPRLMSIAPPAHGSRVMLKLRPRLMSHAPSVLCARDVVRKNRRLMSIAAPAHSDASQSGEFSALDPRRWTHSRLWGAGTGN